MNADLLSNEYFAILANPSFWVAVLRIATPLILGTLGVLLGERAGVLNLGIEGIMVASAFTGWLAVHGGAPLWAGVLVGADSMSRAVIVPTYIADVIVAASLISVLVATSLTQYRIRWK